MTTFKFNLPKLIQSDSPDANYSVEDTLSSFTGKNIKCFELSESYLEKLKIDYTHAWVVYAGKKPTKKQIVDLFMKSEPTIVIL